MTEGIVGVGAELRVGDGASVEVFASIGECISIGGPTMDSEEVDFTHLGSTSGYREKLQGFKDAGQIDVNMNWVATDFDALLVLYNSGDVMNWELELPDDDSSTYEFQGWVKTCPMDVPEGRVTNKVTIRLTGAFAKQA